MTHQYLSNSDSNSENSYPPEPTNIDEWSQWAAKHPTIHVWQEKMAPWQKYADDLARWTMKRLVVRSDVYGGFYVKDGQLRRFKKDGPLTPEIIANHFGLTSLESLIGLYTTSTDDKCKSLTIDFDRHDGESEDLVKKNWQLALSIYETLESLGLHPLLIDSNGTGGLHLRVLFDTLAPAAQIREFGLWLVREWEKFGLSKPPEVFPKQNTIHGKFGNFVRLIGRHHQRQFLSTVWDGKKWQEGEDAIKMILSREGDSTELIPKEAFVIQPAPLQKSLSIANVYSPGIDGVGDQWWKRYSGDLRTLDILSLLETKDLPMSEITDRKYEIECPWACEHTTGESTASILLNDELEEAFPVFHCFHDHCKDRGIKDVLLLFDAEDVNRHCEATYGQDDAVSIIAADDPYDTAGLFLKKTFMVNDNRTLVHHQGEWQIWDGQRFMKITEDDLKATAWRWLSQCQQYSKATKKEPSKLVPYRPTRSSVISLVDALKAVSNLTSHVDAPSWIGSSICKPESVIAFTNGLLDLDRFLEMSDTTLLSHTPRWFSSNCLPHRFDPNAKCPLWLDFLNNVFEGDGERIRALAQWFGYNLTLDNRQQKFAMLIGPPRSGKGTTMTVLTNMLGKSNVANPTLTTLGGRFGLASLIGKQAAVVPDAHLGRNSDSTAILEKLKSIVGCDEQNVDRKNRTELANVRINARFTIAANELPRLPDASVSLKEKMIVIPYNLSFAGKEDYNLSERLVTEIPGITNWALEGLMDLRRSGRLLQPAIGLEIVTDFVRLSSPVSAFLEDCCEIGPDKSEATDLLFRGWTNWCKQNGHEFGSLTTFGAKLRAAVPGLKKFRARRSEGLCYIYQGVQLTDEAAEQVNNASLID